MGLIQDAIKKLREKRREHKSQPGQDIEQYIEHERSNNNVEAMKDIERKDFFSRGNHE